jgi:ubiquinone/menaquinone biosynthesis C-methylase UbiE
MCPSSATLAFYLSEGSVKKGHTKTSSKISVKELFFFYCMMYN